ncbi:MAG: OmpA family protein [Deltaproteobacteria bacterium]|nr:OmpA family protein [Deltaproteobacteria bacterium]
MNNDNRNGREDEAQAGSPSWLVTFSDLSTLLLTFFVLLLSMSSMDDRSLKSMFTNFTSACGILYFKEYGEIYRPKDVLIEGLYDKLKDTLVVKRSDDIAKDLVSETEETFYEKLSGLVIMDLKDGKGFKMIFGQKLLFSSGSAEIKKGIKPILGQVAKFIKASAYQIYIDGHTDNVPIHSAEYPSNEDLSLERAFNIMNYLVKKEGVLPNSIALAGYGELRPITSNDTPDERGKNRRVEIIFKNQKYFYSLKST